MKSVEFICMTTYENFPHMVKKSEVRAFAKRIVKEFKEGLILADKEDRRAWETKQRAKPFTPVKLTLTPPEHTIKISVQKRRLQYPLPSYKPKVTGYRRSNSPDDFWEEKPHCSNTSNHIKRGGWRKMGPNELSRIEELELSNVENMSRIDDLEETLGANQDMLMGACERLDKAERRISGTWSYTHIIILTQ